MTSQSPLNPDDYIWRPSEEFIGQSNIHRFLDQHGLSLKELFQRSKQDPDWYYRATAEDLGIEWFRPYSQTLDLSEGKPWPKWFLGGQLNVVHNCIDRHVNSGWGQEVALVWEGQDGSKREFTYTELQTAINQASGGLLRSGVRKGDRVGIFLPMIAEAVVSFFACLKIGAIAVPVFSGFGAEAVAERLSHCDVRLLITADGFYKGDKAIHMLPVAERSLEKCLCVKKMVVVERLGAVSVGDKPYLTWDDLLTGQSTHFDTVPVESSDPLMILYTSGSTGRPKGTVHTHGGAQMRMPADYAYHLDVKPTDTLLWVTEMGWIMGAYTLIAVLTLRATVMILEGNLDWPTPSRLWDVVERHKVSILGVAPTMVRSLSRHGDQWVTSHPLTSLRILGSTGELWDPLSYGWFFELVGKRRCPIINHSGGTEVGGFFLAPLPILPIKTCSVGGPSPGLDMDVVDGTGQSIRGEVGELVCRNVWPNMTKGLWKDQERYLETYWSLWTDIWVHGDLASIDDDGCWFLHGRSDDTLQIAGKRVGPAEVESVLLSHPAIAEAAAVAFPDRIKGEVLACIVVLKSGFRDESTLSDSLAQQIVESLGKPFRPALIKVVSELPKTRNGKIMRRLIKNVIAGAGSLGDTAGLANPASLDDLRQVLGVMQ